MFFSGLISAHTIVKTTALNGWPPPGQPRLPIGETLINTAALIASGFVLYVGAPRVPQAPDAGALARCWSRSLLGAFFVAFQGAEWVALLREGLTLTTQHARELLLPDHRHARAARDCRLGRACCGRTCRLRRSELLLSQLVTVQIFWYFVVALWPILYWRVYL